MDIFMVFVVFFLLIGFGVYYMIKGDNKEVINIEDELNTPVIDEIPLQDKTYRAQNKYNNIAQNQRTDAIIDVLHKIHFWLVLIGMYILLKMIIAIATFFSLISIGHEATEVIQSLF